MNTAQYDDRCWHELPFDELAQEAQAIASRSSDTTLDGLVADLNECPGQHTADMLINRIETAHAG